jgi:2-polyprenyl-3-methyl-5-hydroxy-6-metoxy-1,4-benzoquinol methylase
MACYLCGSEHFFNRKGTVRDNPALGIRECSACGLVALSAVDHIGSGHYEGSGMHGDAPPPVESWLRATEQDDQRRFEMLKVSLADKRVLDFGCGAGGFLSKARASARDVCGIEPERRIQEYWDGKIPLHSSLDAVAGEFDLITAFHVIEHLVDPRTMLRDLAGRLASGGRLVVEVPNSDDALLTLYQCEPFQRFTYWSQHLFLFNASTLRTLALQAGLRVVAIEQYQRYPLSNHLHWLSHGLPGGHQKWSFLDSPALDQDYAAALAALGKCDTLIAYLETETACRTS